MPLALRVNYKFSALNATSEIRNLDVLIVEDEVDICYLLSSILKRKNFNTSYVTSLFAAQRELDHSNPDIIFIDNHLPDGYGVDFITGIKISHPLTKIIMITAHDTRDDKNKALMRGADYFIGKPFTSHTVIQVLDSLLQAI